MSSKYSLQTNLPVKYLAYGVKMRVLKIKVKINITEINVENIVVYISVSQQVGRDPLLGSYIWVAKTCAIEVLQLYMDRQIMLYSVLWVANYQT